MRTDLEQRQKRNTELSRKVLEAELANLRKQIDAIEGKLEDIYFSFELIYETEKAIARDGDAKELETFVDGVVKDRATADVLEIRKKALNSLIAEIEQLLAN